MTNSECWNQLISSLKGTNREFSTTPKTKVTPKWFSACTDGVKIFISNATAHKPSCTIKGERKLDFKQFEKILPLYLRREQGDSVSKEAAQSTFNQVYWYSLIHHCCKHGKKL